MGKGQSKEGGKADKKEKKGKSSKKGGKSETPKETKENVAVSTNSNNNNNNNNSSSNNNSVAEPDIDWNSPTLYSKNNNKVGVDDFECLKVIGKGSFGKVRKLVSSKEKSVLTLNLR